ncbi:pyridoxal phosphate-dependent decarboxylase family protein [Subtercola sp. YIM 133946]|uniref:pyridoxal phosphate-dependent decarboxylase family protein n=1 Tax=Subtercola sp. YIM 133946 TaxID=3118909 RepID=UPI002F92B855
MSASSDAYDEVLARAKAHALEWLGSLDSRPVGPRRTADELLAQFAQPLPEHPTDPAAVVDELAELIEPGLMAMGSGRFFGWVIGGTLPAALGADWLVSTWDQNAAMRLATPGTAACEEAAAAWSLDLLGLPADSDVGFTTGATMANFVGLAAARQALLSERGWDVRSRGLAGGPAVRVFVGAERHDSVDLALRYLGLPAPVAVDVDEQGRIRPDALAAAMDLLADAALDPSVTDGSNAADVFTIVCLQAGNLHSGAFDPMRESIAVAHARGAWVHVDGAFGLWAAVSEQFAEAVDGLDLADSWATDGHKTLNVPYDCGLAIVRNREAVRAAMGVHASYLLNDDSGPGDPFEKVGEFSRRARGVPVWAALKSLGRAGTIEMVERMAQRARELADGIRLIEGAEVLNDVVFTQVSISFGSDDRTRRVTELLLADGVTWMSGSKWHGRVILRISVSNYSTDEADVERAVDAVRRAVAAADVLVG